MMHRAFFLALLIVLGMFPPVSARESDGRDRQETDLGPSSYVDTLVDPMVRAEEDTWVDGNVQSFEEKDNRIYFISKRSG